MTEHIATIPKNQREEIRVTLDQFKGMDLLNIRVWYRPDNGDMRPGNAGVAVRLDKLPDLAAAVGQALDRAKATGKLK